MWWFAGGIFMKDLSSSKHSNFMLTGIFTFALSGSVVAFGASVGRWVDNTPRLKAARLALLAQNTLLVICASTVAIMFENWEKVSTLWDGSLLIILQIVVVTTAALSRVASIGTSIVMQKDWIVVLANGDLNQLAKVNSVFRSIDLTTQIVAPLIVGIVQDEISKLASAIMIAVWNIVSMCIEYYLLWLIYKENANLSTKEIKVHSPKCVARYADHAVCPEDPEDKVNCLQYRLQTFLYDWLTYIKHPIRMAGVGLSCLYMTVLGFDTVTTAYGNTQITVLMLGIAQGFAALCGMIGSLSYPMLRKRLGLNSTGVMGFSLQFIALIPCVVSIWLPGSPFDASTINLTWEPSPANTTVTMISVEEVSSNNKVISIFTFFGGVILSRYGLWLADISVTQTMQERISENKRGVINGIQDSLNMGMDMLKSLLVILFPYPQQFGFLIIISYVSILLGLIFYLFYYFTYSQFFEPDNIVSSAKESAASKYTSNGETGTESILNTIS
ncbi:hypothetical protein L9F63_007792 [Diploptera punctata]|uniref:Solute carrier family 40 member n=1 Tax=Diploptera punctata TaxID=6984 RepID=A0AAD7Z7I2_DIPPU|nr:hypothetical protein L9F63_007792 [Diploptera punctata]